jgi:hypothetical protein
VIPNLWDMPAHPAEAPEFVRALETWSSDFDLGGGHRGAWLYADGELIGLMEHHSYDELAAGAWPHCAGGGYVAWVPGDHRTALHQLLAGGPGDEAHLTINPSLWHRAKDQTDESQPMHANGSRCSSDAGCHGFIREGRWVSA